MLNSVLQWLETTRVAHAVGESVLLTASLSAAHLIGFTLVMGGALLVDLRLLGMVLPRRPAADVAAPAGRIVALGLAISVITGVLLLSSKATTVIASGAFQLKMLLLLAAGVFHFAVQPWVARRAAGDGALLRTSGAAGLSLWLGLAVTACVFILFE